MARSARRGPGWPAAPAPRPAPVERRATSPRTGRGTSAGPAGAAWTIRGATAATSGSSKWPSSGPSHPSDGTQSESTKATIGLSDAARPALRAPAGPTLVASPTKRRAVALGDPPGGARVGRRVVDDDARQVPECAEQALQLRRPVPHGHHDRDVVGAGGAGAGAPRLRDEGARRDEATRQQPRRGAPAEGGTRPPAVHEIPGTGRNPEEPERAAAQQDRPLVERHRRRILAQPEARRERRRSAGRCVAQLRGRGRGAGVGHRPILAARGRR